MKRFQFSLRTLLIVVTLLAIPCWYVGEQYRIVAHRKAMMARIREHGGNVMFADEASAHGPPASVPFIRKLLGDKALDDIGLPPGIPSSEVREVFPEAKIFPILSPESIRLD